MTTSILQGIKIHSYGFFLKKYQIIFCIVIANILIHTVYSIKYPLTYLFCITTYAIFIGFIFYIFSQKIDLCQYQMILFLQVPLIIIFSQYWVNTIYNGDTFYLFIIYVTVIIIFNNISFTNKLN